MLLPPNVPQSAIERCRPQDRDDAIQEAWVAYLDGKNPMLAINRFRKREAMYRQKIVTNHDLGEND